MEASPEVSPSRKVIVFFIRELEPGLSQRSRLETSVDGGQPRSIAIAKGHPLSTSSTLLWQGQSMHLTCDMDLEQFLALLVQLIEASDVVRIATIARVTRDASEMEML